MGGSRSAAGCRGPSGCSSAPAGALAVAAPPAAAGGSREGLVVIASPMVGTFYAAPSPDADPFVKVGGAVAEDDVVCLIEAMKIFNEIKSEFAGTVEQVLVKSGDPIEFGQEMMLVRPA